VRTQVHKLRDVTWKKDFKGGKQGKQGDPEEDSGDGKTGGISDVIRNQAEGIKGTLKRGGENPKSKVQIILNGRYPPSGRAPQASVVQEEKGREQT